MREVVAALVYNGADKLLIGQRPENRSYGGYWEFPGGKIEPGESPKQAIVREWQEEFEVQITDVEFLKIVEWPEKEIRLHFFKAKCFSPITKLVAHQKIEWIESHQIDDFPLLPIDHQFFREFLK